MPHSGGMRNFLNRIPGAHSAWWYLRTTLIVVLAGAALVSAILALRPPPIGDWVVVAADDLEAGAPVEKSDVRLVAVDASAVPEGALTTLEQAVGQSPRGGVPARTVVTLAALGLDEDADRLPHGFSQIQLRLPQDKVFVEPPAQLEIWGNGGACEFGECPVERLSGASTLVSVTQTASSGGLGSDPAVLATLMVESTQVGAILQAANNDELHLVKPPDRSGLDAMSIPPAPQG